MKKTEEKKFKRVRRKKHIKKVIFRNTDRLRLCIFKSLNHFYAQIIDDTSQSTLVSASTLDKEIRELLKPDMKKTDKSKLVGEYIAKRALAKDIKSVAFDRNGFLYHGRIKEFADAARKAGLDF